MYAGIKSAGVDCDGPLGSHPLPFDIKKSHLHPENLSDFQLDFLQICNKIACFIRVVCLS